MQAGMRMGGFARWAGSLLCLWCVMVAWSTVAWAGTGPVKVKPKSPASPNGQCTTCDPDNPPGPPTTTPHVDSEFIGQTVATTMIAGTTQTVTVQFKNKGSTPWTAATGFRLGTLLDSTWGMDHVDLSTTVNHLQIATFTFSIRTPSTPGNYAFQWMMEHDGVGFLGQPGVGVHIEVLAPAKGTLSSSLNPCNIPAGSTTCTSIVSWTSNRPNTEIWLTELDGSNLSLVSSSGGKLTGNDTINWIWAGG
ncbi:hypothetical protein, partial [Frateuria sp. Soil773]|uniref:hypothetical protein n=1 Tax=Frateuria sp. Soil773 TaxID=1736407 RepID=UPI001F1CC526